MFMSVIRSLFGSLESWKLKLKLKNQKTKIYCFIVAGTCIKEFNFLVMVLDRGSHV